MTNTSKSKANFLEGCSLVRHIPTVEQTRLVKYELELLGLEDEEIDIKLLQTQSHTHSDRGTVCIVVIIGELRRVGPFMMPFPKKMVHANQHWDCSTRDGGGGSRLNPRFYP